MSNSIGRLGRRIAAVSVCAAAVMAAPAVARPSAHVWVTTPDGALKMADRGSVSFHPGGAGGRTITVDPSPR
jgi:hypothetical protein